MKFLRGVAVGLLAGALLLMGVPWYICVIGGCALLVLRADPEPEEPVVVYVRRGDDPYGGRPPGMIDPARSRTNRRRSHEAGERRWDS